MKKTILKTAAVAALALGLLASPFAAASLTSQTVNDHADAARQELREAGPNELVADRSMRIVEGNPKPLVSNTMFANTFDTVSITYSPQDGSPMQGSFSTMQYEGGGGLYLVANGVPPGKYKLVLEQLAPSETVTTPLIFEVTVVDW